MSHRQGQSEMYSKTEGTAARSVRGTYQLGQMMVNDPGSVRRIEKMHNAHIANTISKEHWAYAHDTQIKGHVSQYRQRSFSAPALFDSSGNKTTYLKQATAQTSTTAGKEASKIMVNAQRQKVSHGRLQVNKVEAKIAERNKLSKQRRALRDNIQAVSVDQITSTQDINGNEVGAGRELDIAKQTWRGTKDTAKGVVSAVQTYHAGRFERAEKRQLTQLKKELKAQAKDVKRAHKIKTRARRATMTKAEIKHDKMMMRKAWNKRNFHRLQLEQRRIALSIATRIRGIPIALKNLPGNILRNFRNLLANIAKSIGRSMVRIAVSVLGLGIIAFMVILILVMPLFIAGGESTTSAYQTDETTVISVEHDFVTLEEALEESLSTTADENGDVPIETTYPGYDEYEVVWDPSGEGSGFSHNSFDLASYLNAVYGNYAGRDMSAILQSILGDMYTITTSTSATASGGTKLTVTIKKKSIDTIARERITDSDTLALYNLYRETNGQYPDLFNEDLMLINNEGQRFNYYDYVYGEGNINPSNPKWAHVYGTATSNPFSAALFSAAAPHLGTPYVWGGASPSGWDCSGFVCWSINHSVGNVGRMTANNLRVKATDPVASSGAMPGDLVFFHGTTDTSIWGQASHVGIYLGNGYMIHAGSTRTGTSIVSINTKWYQEHLLGFGRLKTEYING